MKASLNNYHQPPRKVRLVADLVRGKSIPAAREALAFLPKKSSPAIAKLIESAVSNAKDLGIAAEDIGARATREEEGPK